MTWQVLLVACIVVALLVYAVSFTLFRSFVFKEKEHRNSKAMLAAAPVALFVLLLCGVIAFVWHQTQLEADPAALSEIFEVEPAVVSRGPAPSDKQLKRDALAPVDEILEQRNACEDKIKQVRDIKPEVVEEYKMEDLLDMFDKSGLTVDDLQAAKGQCFSITNTQLGVKEQVPAGSVEFQCDPEATTPCGKQGTCVPKEGSIWGGVCKF